MITYFHSKVLCEICNFKIIMHIIIVRPSYINMVAVFYYCIMCLLWLTTNWYAYWLVVLSLFTYPHTQKVLTKWIGLSLFQSDHFLDQDPIENHFVLLVKIISKKFFTVKVHHFTELYNDTIHKQNIRSHLSKTITFIGQWK